MPKSIKEPQTGKHAINAHRVTLHRYEGPFLENPALPPISKGNKVLLNANSGIPYEIYEPKEASGQLNTLFYFPGTASQAHAPQVTPIVAGSICKVMTCRVIVVYHRLAPENKYPTPDNDAAGVIQHFLDDPTLNLNNIALGGHSSGGLLALNLCLNNPGMKVSQLLLIAPVVDLDACTHLTTDPSKRQVEPAFFKAFVNQYLPSYQDPGKSEVSPFHHTAEALAALPPIIMVSGGDDILFPSIKAFLEKAEKLDDPHSQLEVVPDKNHYLAWQSGKYMKDIEARFQENFSQERGINPRKSIILNIRPACEEKYLGMPPYFSHAQYVHRKTLEKAAQDNLQTHPLIAYTGDSGKGKTQLALYHYYMLPNYKYRLWIDCSTDETLKLSFSSLTQALKLPSELSISEKIVRIKTWLKDQPDCLIVFDNAQSIAQIKHYLPNGVKAIVTSLNKQEPWPIKTQVNELTPEERKQFLPSNNEQLHSFFAENTPPLALQLAQNYIIETGTSLLANKYKEYQASEAKCSLEEFLFLLFQEKIEPQIKKELASCITLLKGQILSDKSTRKKIKKILLETLNKKSAPLHGQEQWSFEISENSLAPKERKELFCLETNELKPLFNSTASASTLSLAKKYILSEGISGFVEDYKTRQLQAPQSNPEEICFSLCLSRLEPEALEVLELCALLAPSNIPYNSLLKVDLSKIMALGLYHFFIEDAFNDNLSLHNLVQLFIRRTLLNDRHKTISLTNNLLEKFSKYEFFLEEDREKGKIIPHASSTLQFIKENELTEELNLINIVTLGFNLTYVCTNHFGCNNGLEILEEYYALYKAHEQTQKNQKIEWRYNDLKFLIAWIQSNIDEEEKACNSMLKLCNANDSALDKDLTAKTQRAIGMHQHRLGNLDKAEKHLKISNRIYLDIQRERGLMKIEMLSLASVYFKLACIENSRGKYESAKEYCNQAKQAFISYDYPPEESALFLRFYYEIMGLSSLKDDPIGAKKFLAQALIHRLNTLGEEHLLVAKTNASLGLASQDLESAKAYFIRGYNILEKKEGKDDNVYLADYYLWAAKMLLRFSQKETAKAFLLASINIQRAILPKKYHQQDYKLLELNTLLEETFEEGAQAMEIRLLTQEELKETLIAVGSPETELLPSSPQSKQVCSVYRITKTEQPAPVTATISQAQNPCVFFATATASAALGVAAGCLATQYLLSS